jgi:hypothetical protein
MKSESEVIRAGGRQAFAATTGQATAVPAGARAGCLLLTTLVGLLAACSATPHNDAAPPPPQVVEPGASKATAAEPAAAARVPAPKAAAGGDQALADGLKFYQGGQYHLAETQLKTALQNGLSAPDDVANAHKHLAFIYCTSKRDKLCVAAFKAAKAADPAFALSKAEAGHPMWSKAYKKALGLK